MSEPGGRVGAERRVETADAKRRLRAKVFGDVLPDSTSDDRSTGVDADAEQRDEDWLRNNVPPHHG